MDRKLYVQLLLTSLLSIAWQQVFAQGMGFTRQENIKTAGIINDNQVSTLPLTGKQSTMIYYDGLGRTVQTVGVQASALQNDLVQPEAYDNQGRQVTAYLPYAGKAADVAGSYRPNAISTDQPAFYNNTAQQLIATDVAPYTQQVFENSPLQRLLSAGMPGNGFQPVAGQHYKTVSYRANDATDGNILIWNPNGSYTTGTYYQPGSLSITDDKDQDNSETLTFTDLAGHIVLKRQKLQASNLDTYYLYNDAGMISYMIPPLATGLLAAGSYNLSAAPLNTAVFKFVYDTRGRLVEKTVPSKGTMYIVYDPMNRPVLLQDANMLAHNQWNYIRYDVKGRVVSQGIYTDASRTGRVNMQTYVNTLAASYLSVWFESRNTVAATGYYTQAIFPTTATGTLTPLNYAYYDDYDLKQTGSDNYTYATQSLTGEQGATTAKVKGLPTMTRSTTVGAGIATNTWLLHVVFYDKRGNQVQDQSNNQLHYTAEVVTDYKTTVPDFTGVPLITKIAKQTTAGSPTTVQTNLTYDHINRITGVSQQYNGGAATQIAVYTYNELGQLVKKGLGQVATGSIPATQNLTGTYNGTNNIVASSSIAFTAPMSIPSGSTFTAMITNGYLQVVDYRYNVRGQLLSINNSKLSNDGGVTNTDNTDLFGMQFLYDQVDANVGNSAYYNGKLSAVKWMSKNDDGVSSYERSYKYNYDAVNRFTAAGYAERTAAATGAFSNNISGFDESGITYDVNGNILTLNRNSSAQGTNTHTQVDNLAYTYDSSNPNRLQKVSDGTGANYTGYGFRNLTGAAGTSVYSYDVNGNLTADPYKGLSLSYNNLNRTDKITVTTGINRFINYTYDAAGSLIRKQQYDNNVVQATTDYIDGFVYLNGVLSYFGMPEGRIRNTGTALKPEYIIGDQQGNARISFEEGTTAGQAIVRQENSYYAFGLVMPNSPVSTPTTDNKQLYNGGSEWQNDYGNLPDYYQTFNRNYDAALGRFIGVDPVAESEESMGGYQYAGNNPVMYNDPLGNLKLPKGQPAVNWFTYESGYYQEKFANLYNPGGGDITGVSDSGDFGGGGGNSNNGDYGDFWTGFAAVSPYGSYDAQTISRDYNNWYYTGLFDATNQVEVLPEVSIEDAGWKIQQEAYNTKYYKNANQGGNWETPVGQGNWAFGLAATSTESFSGIARIGSNLSMYTATANGGVFMGNQYVKTLSLSKAGGLLGKVSFGVGVLTDGIGVYNYYQNPNGPNAVSPGKAGVDTGMGLVGLTGFGTLPALTYFGIDAFYPGGFPAAMKNAAPIYNQLNQPSTAPSQVLWGMP